MKLPERLSLDGILGKLARRHGMYSIPEAPAELPQSACSCPKPPDCYGLHGWHWRPNPEHPTSPQMGIAYEACPTMTPERQRSTRFMPVSSGLRSTRPGPRT